MFCCALGVLSFTIAAALRILFALSHAAGWIAAVLALAALVTGGAALAAHFGAATPMAYCTLRHKG